MRKAERLGKDAFDDIITPNTASLRSHPFILPRMLLMATCQIKPMKDSRVKMCSALDNGNDIYLFQLVCTRLIFDGVGAASGLKDGFQLSLGPKRFALLLSSR